MDAHLSQRGALAALSELPRYEESLTARTGGLTLMLWGMASAGIFLTYAAAADWLEARDAVWALAVLWVPWVAAGMAASAALWASHAVSLRREATTRRDVLAGLGWTAAHLAIAAGLFLLLDVVAGVEWSPHSVMAAANGLFALAMATWNRHAWGSGSLVLGAAGGAMVAAGLGLGLAALDPTATGLLAALATGLGWFGAGLVCYRMG